MADNYAFGKPKLGPKSFINTASPGPQNPRSAVTAPSTGAKNAAKPGGPEKVPARVRGGKGSIARPGGAQKVKG